MAQVQYAVHYSGRRLRYGEEGKLILFQREPIEISRKVVLQFSELPQTCINVSSNYIHHPILTTTMLVDGRNRNVRVLPPFEKCMHDLVQKDNIYAVVRVKGMDWENTFTFSESLKRHLLEVSKGVKAMHKGGVVHGNIDGRSMILVANNVGTLMGRIVGSSQEDSSGVSDWRDDWKNVAEFLKEAISRLAKQQQRYVVKRDSLKLDSDIKDWLNLLMHDAVTDDEVVDHIALWPTRRMVDFIQAVENHLMAAGIKLDQNAILDSKKWHFKLDERIRLSILQGHYGPELTELIRFIRNMAEHGHQRFSPIAQAMNIEFSFDAKSVFGMIGAAFPGFFVKLLKEAKKNKIPIPG